jgi:hypothetical protein
MSGIRLMRPHYVDPQSNIVYDTNNADFEGWLTKQSAWLKVSTDFFQNDVIFAMHFSLTFQIESFPS